MSVLNLDIKLKHVRNYEKTHGSISSILQNDGSSIGLCDFLNSMGKTDEEIEQLLREHGMEEITFSVVEDLQSAGFLPRSVNVRAEVEKASRPVDNQNSQTSPTPTGQ